MRNRSKDGIRALVLAVLFLLAGCAGKGTDDMEEAGRPQVDLSPRFIPAKSEPFFDETAGETMFQWPGEDYSLYVENQELYAFSQDLGTKVHLFPERQRVQANHWEAAAIFMEANGFKPTGFHPMLEGFVVTGEINENSSGLVHFRSLKDESPVVLPAKAADQKGHEPAFIRSPDGSKIAYFDETAGSLAAYHVVTGRITRLTALTADWLSDEWTRQTTFSPKGGYLLVEQMDDDGRHLHQFITYGADSGRQIHALLPGIAPQMNVEETKIAFLLDPDARKENEQAFRLVQVGTYSLDRRETQFINRVTPEYHIFGKPVFSETYPYLLYGARPIHDNTESLKTEEKLITYHLNQQVQQTQVIQNGHLVETEGSIYFDYPWLVYPLQQEQATAIVFHQFEKEWTEVVGDIQPWEELLTGEVTYFTGTAATGFTYVQHHQLIHFKEGVQQVLLTLPESYSVKQVLPHRQWHIVLLETLAGDRQTVLIENPR